jgi:hypothetical protein
MFRGGHWSERTVARFVAAIRVVQACDKFPAGAFGALVEASKDDRGDINVKDLLEDAKGLAQVLTRHLVAGCHRCLA